MTEQTYHLLEPGDRIEPWDIFVESGIILEFGHPNTRGWHTVPALAERLRFSVLRPVYDEKPKEIAVPSDRKLDV